MLIPVILINSLAIGFLILGFIKNRKKTVQSLKIAWKSFTGIVPTILSIIVIIGLIQGFVSEEMLVKTMGQDAGLESLIITGLLGAIIHIPAIIAYPMSASLLEGGASIQIIAVFITTLTMVGFVTLPLEIRELGKRFAVIRNVLSFVTAILIALLMGIFLG
ncbi:MAG: permease [Candidatus Marinimicrobia bacterium]|nr:permease [Candidatus Neomarinimicrobiota bacterium]